MNTVTVKINGVEYNLKGKENEKYLLEVASYVDSKFREISANNNKLGTSSVAVLAALNIADELFKSSLENEDILKKKSLLEERHLTIKERIREMKSQVDEITKSKNNEIDALKNIIFSMEERIKVFEEEQPSDDLYNEKIKYLQDEIIELRKNEEKLNSVIQSKEIEIEEAFNNKSITESEEIKSLNAQMSIMEQELKGTINEKETLKSKNKEMKFLLQNSKYKVLDLEKKLIDAQFDLAVEKKRKNPLLK